MFLYNKVLEKRRKLNDHKPNDISGPKFSKRYSNVGQLLKEEKRVLHQFSVLALRHYRARLCQDARSAR